MAWNMSCTDESCSQQRFALTNSDFLCIVAHELLKFKDTRNTDLIKESIFFQNTLQTSNTADHNPSVA